MLANMAFTWLPISESAPTMTMLIKVAINAYSMAVDPRRSRAKTPTIDRAASG
jgi:hypothetical protein